MMTSRRAMRAQWKLHKVVWRISVGRAEGTVGTRRTSNVSWGGKFHPSTIPAARALRGFPQTYVSRPIVSARLRPGVEMPCATT
jgi:hypothetical protein